MLSDHGYLENYQHISFIEKLLKMVDMKFNMILLVRNQTMNGDKRFPRGM